MKTQDKLERIKSISNNISAFTSLLSRLNEDGVWIKLYTSKGGFENEFKRFSVDKDDFFPEIQKHYVANLKVAVRNKINELTILLSEANAAL